MVNIPKLEFVKDTYCSWCGNKFIEQVEWPRKCFVCNNDSYKNPIPIVVSVIPIFGIDNPGVLIQQRNIEPKKGEWALPSGYINFNETWEEAAVRENKEEMGIVSSIEDYKLLCIKKPTSGNMLIFCVYQGRLTVEDCLENFKPNDEVTAISSYNNTKVALAFPTHNEVVKEFFEKVKDHV